MDFGWCIVGAGLSMFAQRFETRGYAPSNTTLAPLTSLRLAVASELVRGVYAELDLSAETHFLRLERQSGRQELSMEFALRSMLAVGKHF